MNKNAHIQNTLSNLKQNLHSMFILVQLLLEGEVQNIVNYSVSLFIYSFIYLFFLLVHYMGWVV